MSDYPDQYAGQGWPFKLKPGDSFNVRVRELEGLQASVIEAEFADGTILGTAIYADDSARVVSGKLLELSRNIDTKAMETT